MKTSLFTLVLLVVALPLHAFAYTCKATKLTKGIGNTAFASSLPQRMKVDPGNEATYYASFGKHKLLEEVKVHADLDCRSTAECGADLRIDLWAISDFDGSIGLIAGGTRATRISGSGETYLPIDAKNWIHVRCD